MATATRFTSRYEPTEDRIQLFLELSEEEVQILWLTRRLLNRMLPHLIRLLNQSSPTTSVDTAPSAGKSDSAHKEAVQRFSQEAAVGAIERQPAVGAGGQRPKDNFAYLVTSVDIHTGPKSLRLDFKSGEEILHTLPFGEAALRQWLSILYAQYRAGGWQEPFWPAWIGGKVPGEAPKENLVLN